MPERVNSRGWDLANRSDMNDYVSERAPFAEKLWRSSPITVRPVTSGTAHKIFNPALTDSQVGEVIEADVEQALNAITEAQSWDAPVAERAAVLRKAADLYEQHHGEIFALLAREAGKTQFDTIAELREAVDFLRYYAKEAEKNPDKNARGIISCISPWNFPPGGRGAGRRQCRAGQAGGPDSADRGTGDQFAARSRCALAGASAAARRWRYRRRGDQR